MPKAYKQLPPAAELWELFDYKPLTGELVRKSTGKSIGARDSRGYLSVRFAGTLVRNHRIIWAWVTGSWPNEIDHINRCKGDNRWLNLRDVTHQQNMLNTKPWVERSKNQWRARACIDGKRVEVGRFTTREAAEVAALQYKQERLSSS